MTCLRLLQISFTNISLLFINFSSIWLKGHRSQKLELFFSHLLGVNYDCLALKSYHGKGPMDGVGVTVKNVTFRVVLSVKTKA